MFLSVIIGQKSVSGKQAINYNAIYYISVYINWFQLICQGIVVLSQQLLPKYNSLFIATQLRWEWTDLTARGCITSPPIKFCNLVFIGRSRLISPMMRRYVHSSHFIEKRAAANTTIIPQATSTCVLINLMQTEQTYPSLSIVLTRMTYAI